MKKIAMAILLLGVAGLLSSCCSVIPFIKCKDYDKIITVVGCDASCNNSRPLQIWVMVFEEYAKFQTIPTQMIFDSAKYQAQYAELGVQYVEEFFVSPKDAETLIITLSPELLSKKKELYVGVVGNFSGGSSKDKYYTSLRKMPLHLNLYVNNGQIIKENE